MMYYVKGNTGLSKGWQRIMNTNSIQEFLESSKDTMFFHSDSDSEFTKEAISLGFQEWQEHGAITIEEYIEKLKDYLKAFVIQTFSNGVMIQTNSDV